MSEYIIIPIMLFFMLLATAVPVIIGLFVYRDAKARGMDPLLWTLLAIFAPGFIGLLIYLIMRRDHVKLICPDCGSEVQQSFVSCPACGHKLAASCVKCGAALNPEWKLCPQCGTVITQTSDFSPPVVAKPDKKGFFIAIIAIMAVPLALILIAASLFVYTGVTMTGENDSETEKIYNFTDQMDIEPVYVTSSDVSALTDSHRSWIRQKQTGKKGIYSMTFSMPENGEVKTDEFTCTYNIVYDYTVIVVNDKKEKAYVADEFDYTTIEYLPDSVNITLSEAVPDDEEAVQYGNVFVIRTISQYSMTCHYTTDRKPEKLENKRADSDNAITVKMENGSSYTIPGHNDKEYYTPFKK